MSGCSSVHAKASLGKEAHQSLNVSEWSISSTSVKPQVDTLLPSIGGNGNILI